MRSKFPLIWIIQFVLLGGLSLIVFVHPISVLQFVRGQKAPKEVEKPRDALNEWVLKIDQFPVPNPTVRDFFRDHNAERRELRRVWTPHDRDIADFLPKDARSRESEVDQNKAWEAVENWVLSATPPPDDENRARITAWVDSVDEVPAASSALASKINQGVSLQPTDQEFDELRMMILDARQTLPISWELGSDQIRLTAPCILAAALFTLLGMMSPSIRRPLARIFVIIALFWTLAGLKSSTGPQSWNLVYGVWIAGVVLGIAMVVIALKAVPRLSTGGSLLLIIAAWWVSVVAIAAFGEFDGGILARTNIVIGIGFVACMGIANAYYWLVGKNEDPAQDDAGIAQRRPPQLWTMWLVQFGLLIGNGLLAIIYPDWIAELFMKSEFDFSAKANRGGIVDDSVQFLGVWIVALALFSYFALGVARDWIWQGVGLIFCFVFALLGITTVVFGSSGEYTVWAFLYGCQGVVFIPITIYLLTQKDPWTAANVERAQNEDWKLVDLLIAPRMIWRLRTGHRRLFRYGVGASGRLTILPNSNQDSNGGGRPENEFFQPGTEFPVQMRFSNCLSQDDAALDIRGCGLRCSDRETSPFNLMFATGGFGPYSTVFDFRRILLHQNSKKLIQKSKIAREGFAAGMRRAPGSYAELIYYDHVTLEWLAPNSIHYVVRFRLVPKENASELDHASSGLPDERDLEQLWNSVRRENETRPDDYLRQELVNRLTSVGPIKFELQMQFHEPSSDDSHDWYDASLEWGPEFQWHSLAEIVLDQPLAVNVTESLQFDPSCLPRSLHVPNPESLAFVSDPRTLGVARYRIGHLIGKLRMARRKWWTKSASQDSGAG